VVHGSGEVLKASGEAGRGAGKALQDGGKEAWDFASGETASRPALDRTFGTPPAKAAAPKDPAPGDAMKRKM
jgi:hypothetical protein